MFPEAFYCLLVFAAIHLLKIYQFPFHGRQFMNMFNAEQTPLGFSLLHRKNEAFLIEMSPIAFSRSVRGRYVKSISTESLGRSLIKKLIAVPPFNAKTFTFEKKGMI